MRRREFITLLGGAAAWPLVARAQQQERCRSSVSCGMREAPKKKARYFTALLQGFRDLGYIDGRTIKLEHRFPK